MVKTDYINMGKQEELGRRIRKLTRGIREAYHKSHREEPFDYDIRAFGGKPMESIGAFAEYNLRGYHCPRSKAGLCTPCFYSRFPSLVNIDYQQLMMIQIDDILDNFQELIVEKVSGKIYYDPKSLMYQKNRPIACCITPVGSFFDEKEFPKEVRNHLLMRLIEISDSLSRDVILYVETHAIDFLHWNAPQRDLEMMLRLHLRIVFGFESSDSFVRNVLYAKDIELEKFEKAVLKAKSNSFGTYAFTFAGLNPMFHQEIIDDVERTFLYFKKMDIIPVVMFANIQEYTIPDVLKKYNIYGQIHPITVIEIIKKMIDMFGRIREDGCDAWLMADPVGGPPTPAHHIFSGDEVPCCSGKIYQVIQDLREDHEYAMFENDYRQISQCENHKKKIDYLLFKEKKSLTDRTEQMIKQAEDLASTYITEKRGEEFAVIKAHLLCEGVRMGKKERVALQKLGISEGFIHSTNLMIDDMPVNACLMEKFNEEPSCRLSYEDNNFYLFFQNKADDSGETVKKVDFLKIPKWGRGNISGYLISDYLRPHSKECISIWPNQICSLGKERCKFCSLHGNVTLPVEVAAEMIETALLYNPRYEVHISGGIYKNMDENIKYYSDMVHTIRRKHPSTKISLETIPPSSVEGLNHYHDSGVNSILMNIEIADEDIRNRLCPGKGKISNIRYFKAYEEAVEIFGNGNVGSVILYGIDGVSVENILSYAERMCKAKTMPILIPFQPLKNSEMYQEAGTDPQAYMEVAKAVSDIRDSYIGKESLCDFGCINCGACSIDKFQF